MKTTVQIDDVLFQLIEAEAARQGKTMSELIEAGLRLLLRRPTPRAVVTDLPSFDLGLARVDVANRNALYSAIERR